MAIVAAADLYELHHCRLVALDHALVCSKVDYCVYYRVKDGYVFFVLDTVACSFQKYVDDWLAHFRGTPETDDYPNVQRIRDATRLLSMQITPQYQLRCIDQECQMGVLIVEYGVHNCKPVLTHV